MWRIEQLPFVWSHRSTPSNAPLPDTLPFILSIDSQSGRFLQVASTEVRDALTAAYRSGSVITGAMDEKGIGRKYADDFLASVRRQIQKSDLPRLRVLDIGCGNGYLSRQLAGMGHEVIGIDPGNQLIETSSDGLQLIRDFFPSPMVTGKFDLILAYALLEHIEDPVAFLISLREFLSSDGTVVVAVPDCASPIESGDPSMLVHEHYSYFTTDSLRATLELSGFQVETIQRAGFGGMLYASSSVNSQPVSSAKSLVRSDILTTYMHRVENNLLRVKRLMSDLSHERKTIGVVVPGRFVNALTMLNIPGESVRFFDDNPSLHGTFYPSIAVAIEPTENLISRPTDLVLVMSQTFGDEIASRLRQLLPMTTHIMTMNELFEDADVAAH